MAPVTLEPTMPRGLPSAIHVADDPFTDVEVTGRVDFVMKEGKICTQP